MQQQRSQPVSETATEIVSLNIDDLDIHELENRLAATSSWADDGWGGCGCNQCGQLKTCTDYTCSTLCLD